MHSILTQSLQIITKIKTQHDAQKLLGTINCVRTLLGISNLDLEPIVCPFKGRA